tara:strand:+ start:133 stop:462 length:330 start_codon:yes stop_codon:yes gene_type:complete
MVSFRDRKSTREELVGIGYSWEYLDTWQPKTVLYRHADGLNVNGDVVHPYGSKVKGVPGNPDYVIKKAKIGFFPYPPNEHCGCPWCIERKGKKEEGAVTIDRGSSSSKK